MRKRWPCGCETTVIVVEADPLWKESTLIECGLDADGCQRFTGVPEHLPVESPWNFQYTELGPPVPPVSNWPKLVRKAD